MVRSNVDLPDPDGPTMTNTLPWGTSKEMSSSTGLSALAYRLTRCLISRLVCVFPAVLRGLRNLFSLLSHASTFFSNLRATMDSGQHTMKYMKKIVP